MLPVLAEVTGEPVLEITPKTVAEDFSEYGEVVPSLFLFLGNWPEGVDPTTQPGNHSPLFDVHEPFLEVGVKAFVGMVAAYLGDDR
jgi:amidohydrolase